MKKPKAVLEAALVLATSAVMGTACGTSEKDARDWVRRVVMVTPRIAQILFQLPAPPVSTFSTTGKEPDWIRDVRYDRFTWTRNGDEYRAEATAIVDPGPGLRGDAGVPMPPARSVRVELTVNFSTHVTPPPIIFLPEGKSVEPDRWTIHRVDGRVVEESGLFVVGTQ